MMFYTHRALLSDSLLDKAGVRVGAIFTHVLSIELVSISETHQHRYGLVLQHL